MEAVIDHRGGQGGGDGGPGSGGGDGPPPPSPRPTHMDAEHVNDRRPNFRDEHGNLYLVRCYSGRNGCHPEYGRENYILGVAYGVCAWCGWRETTSDGA